MIQSAITGCVVTLLAFGPPADRPTPQRGAGAFSGAGICRQIECTPAQEEQVAQIFEAHRAEVAQDRAQAQQLRREMAAELAQSQLDTEKLQRLQTQLSQVHAKMAQARLQSTIELHGMLTPSQREALAEHMASRGPGSGMRGKPRRGRSGAE
jgi:Spy/CpxP family protein refolding chaperone